MNPHASVTDFTWQPMTYPASGLSRTTEVAGGNGGQGLLRGGQEVWMEAGLGRQAAWGPH